MKLYLKQFCIEFIIRKQADYLTIPYRKQNFKIKHVVPEPISQQLSDKKGK